MLNMLDYDNGMMMKRIINMMIMKMVMKMKMTINKMMMKIVMNMMMMMMMMMNIEMMMTIMIHDADTLSWINIVTGCNWTVTGVLNPNKGCISHKFQMKHS